MVLLLWSCTASQPAADENADARKCGPPSLAEEGCPIDACASGCSSVESGIACCAEAHGYGNFDDYNLERLTGACAGADCNEDLYLSPPAALCAAQVHGLESGIGWCGSTFEFVGHAATWMGINTGLNECVDGREFGDVGYDMIHIDARTGEYTDASQAVGIAECPE